MLTGCFGRFFVRLSVMWRFLIWRLLCCSNDDDIRSKIKIENKEDQEISKILAARDSSSVLN